MYLVIFYLFCSIGFSGTIDPETKDEQYISYGKNFVHIGQLAGYDNNHVFWTGSGIAIDHHIILTAAHLVHDTKTCNIKINNKTIKLNSWIIHDNFDFKKLGINDIAIGLLSESVELSNYPTLYTKRDELNKDCSIAGFGSTGSFITGPVVFDDKLRAGSNVIDNHDRGCLVCSPSAAHKKTKLEFLIAPGDSGGGLFIDNQLAGINSAVYRTKINGKLQNEYFSESLHTRISDHIDWINNKKNILLKTSK